MQVIHAVDAPKFELPGVEFTGLAAPSRGSAGLCTWKLTVAPGHGGDAPHTLDRDEVFMVLSGTVQITPDGEKLGPGDAVVVPAGEPISLTNLGEGLLAGDPRQRSERQSARIAHIRRTRTMPPSQIADRGLERERAPR